MVLGIGYLRTFKDFQLPFTDQPFTAFWLIIVIAYAVRRLPYALRSCTAALQQLHVSLEEAAENLGASKNRTIYRVVVPLMAGGILAGFVTSFLTAAVELSATIMLVTAQSNAPMSYGIYLYMQSIAGRGPGAPLADSTRPPMVTAPIRTLEPRPVTVGMLPPLPSEIVAPELNGASSMVEAVTEPPATTEVEAILETAPVATTGTPVAS